MQKYAKLHVRVLMYIAWWDWFGMVWLHLVCGSNWVRDTSGRRKLPPSRTWKKNGGVQNQGLAKQIEVANCIHMLVPNAYPG